MEEFVLKTEPYEAPAIQVVEVKSEGVICASKDEYTPISW